MTHAAVPQAGERRALADALAAAATELEAQHMRCSEIDAALGRGAALGPDRRSDDYAILQEMDQHRQIIGDLSTFLRGLAAACADVGHVDTAEAYTAIRLASLRDRLLGAAGGEERSSRQEVEVF